MASTTPYSTKLQEGINALKECLGEAAVFLKEKEADLNTRASFQLPLPKDCFGIERILTISFPNNFPESSIKLRVDPSTWLYWPHAMPENLCLYAAGQRPPYGDAITIVRETIDRFKELIRLVLEGSDAVERKRHFDNEVQTYWMHQLPRALHQLVLLDRPKVSGPMRVISKFDLSTDDKEPSYWVASDEKLINSMQRKLYWKSASARVLASAAFYVKLDSVPSAKIPLAHDFLVWIAAYLSNSDRSKLHEWFNSTNELTVRWVIAELPNSDPPTVQAFVLRDKGLKAQSFKQYGTRAGRKKILSHSDPIKLVLQRARCHLVIEEVVYSRFMSDETVALRSKKVALIGVGSLGSQVAANLLRTGIETLTLIDFDVFQDANLGRHVLGMDALGSSKAKALAYKLQRDFPLSTVRYFDDFLGCDNVEMNHALSTVDLVINTTANWHSEKIMWLMKIIYNKWACIQAWTEPHGIVAHALYCAATEPSMPNYLFDKDGGFLHKFSLWPNGGVHRLPACGDSYIMGGPIALASSAIMVSSMVIEVLLDSTKPLRWDTQISNIDLITLAGGEYIGEAVPSGVRQITLSRPWPVNDQG